LLSSKKKGDQIDDLNVGQASCLLLSIGAAALSLVTDSKKIDPTGHLFNLLIFYRKKDKKRFTNDSTKTLSQA
jgi:hypothetical protein